MSTKTKHSPSEWSFHRQLPKAHFCEECGFLLEILSSSSGKVFYFSFFSSLFLFPQSSLSSTQQIDCHLCGRKYDSDYLASINIITKSKLGCGGLIISFFLSFSKRVRQFSRFLKMIFQRGTGQFKITT